MHQELLSWIRTRWSRSLCLAIFMVLMPFGQGIAIEIDPSRAQIDAALEQGKTAALQRIAPDRLYAWFGPFDDLEPRGFLMTKVVGLRVMAAHFALRGEHPSQSEIQSILDEPSLLVSVTLFGDSPMFAVDSYMLLRQQDRMIKPIKVRSTAGRPARGCGLLLRATGQKSSLHFLMLRSMLAPKPSSPFFHLPAVRCRSRSIFQPLSNSLRN